MTEIVRKYYPAVTAKQIKAASAAAYASYEGYFAALRAKGEEFLRRAEAEGKPVIVLCGRPYHVDPEINHGIQSLICRLGAVVVT